MKNEILLSIEKIIARFQFRETMKNGLYITDSFYCAIVNVSVIYSAIVYDRCYRYIIID